MLHRNHSLVPSHNQDHHQKLMIFTILGSFIVKNCELIPASQIFKEHLHQEQESSGISSVNDCKHETAKEAAFLT